MRTVIQRVSKASLFIDGIEKGSIGRGLVVLAGFGRNDTEHVIDVVVRKILKLRIFEDTEGKMNHSLLDVSGGLMIVSQFTLYARTEGGNRPDFLEALKAPESKILFDKFVETFRTLYEGHIIAGEFGKHMLVEIHNDGPVTIILNIENERRV